MVSADAARQQGRFAEATLADCSLGMLILCAGIPLLIGAYALLSAPVVLSREMTWDLLFNLAGAWHVFNGHVPHVDFHDPGGELNFILTALGFKVVGVNPRGFVVGSAVVTLAISAAATFVAWRRLPLLPAALFVLFSGFQVLMPASPGDQPNAYSFAMSYNRYGWSAWGVLALLLFVPPRNGRTGDTVDLAIATALLVGMFYIKVTYFAAGLLATACALLVCAHLRARWRAWTVAGIAVVANALAPYGWPYVSDVVTAARTGAVRDDLVVQSNFLLNHATEYACGLAFAAIALWLWRRGDAPGRLPFAVALLFVMGLLLLTQNSQSHGVPFGVVAALMLYDALRQKPGADIWSPAPLPVILLIFPVLSLAAAVASVAGYARAAAGGSELTVVMRTNLQGLAVPKTDIELLAAFDANAAPGYGLLNKARETRARHELHPAEYVETLMEASQLLEARKVRGGIVLLDQVNPLPFMLGLVPPTGGYVWSDHAAALLPAERVLRDAEVVLIPKFSTWRHGTMRLLAAYQHVLATHYKPAVESRSWFLFERAATTNEQKGDQGNLGALTVGADSQME